MTNDFPTSEEIVRKIRNPKPRGRLVMEFSPRSFDELDDEPRKITLYSIPSIIGYWKEVGQTYPTREERVRAMLDYNISIRDFISSTLFDISMTHTITKLTYDVDLGAVTKLYVSPSETTNIDADVIDAVCGNIRSLDDAIHAHSGGGAK